ncbi:MAG: helix-turn-helix domain-containing protein, partial [Bacteroidota bacterium]
IIAAYEQFVTYHSHTPVAIKYTDSIIMLSKNANLGNHPAEGYLLKGIQLYYNTKYNAALDNFALANNLALQNKNIAQQISVKHYIGLLKNVSKETAEALKIFENNLKFILDNTYEVENPEQYLKSLFALADSYNKNKIFDKAEQTHQEGIKASLAHPTRYLYPWFLTSHGITSYYTENYAQGRDSLQKAATFFATNEKALCSNYLFTYKCLTAQQETEQAIVYLNKIDSIYQQKPKVIFQAREAYEFLNQEYKAKGDRLNQLEAIEKLLVVDKLIEKDYQNLGKLIVKKYDTPMLISEKEELINELEDSNFLSQKTILVLVILSALLSIVIFYYVRRNTIYKKRFESLMKKYADNERKTDTMIRKIPATDAKENLGLSSDIVDAVLVKLDKFEKSHKFTKKSYTLTKLAKELDTNSTYLSKIINYTKGINFANYMNELRIDYAISQLKENKLFRSYTIKAIAIEVGFNNAQSFSIAFHRKTGIYPSYFLKQLDNQELKTTA